MSIEKTLLSRRDVLMGSAAAGGLALVSPPSLALAAGGEDLPKALAGDLAGRLRGTLVTPSDAAYDDARRVWNGMIDRYPSAIAGCTGTSDVMTVIRFAREHDLPVTVRGGGHNVAGKSLRDGSITIDLGPMQGIWVDAEAKRGRVQGGVRWASFDRETLARKLYVTGGTVGSTGVAGLTLGGGLGWLMRKHGLTCDNLVAADVVTADGEALRASASENPDLFWALRGGGGNFGVVTSFEFQLHDEEPVYGGIVFYPENEIGGMLRMFRDYTATAPDSVTAMAAVAPGPAGSPLEGRPCGMAIFCHNGPLAEGEKLAQPFRDFGSPAIDTMGPSDYATQQGLFAAAGTPGMRNYWRSNFMKAVGDDVIDTMVDHAGELPPPGSMMLIEHLGGAVARVGENETAFANRGAEYNVSILSAWVDAADDPENIAWTRAFGDELKSYATGGAYVNYMAGDESAEAVRGAYEANFQRLVAVKRKYDPDNFFSGNQNIAP